MRAVFLLALKESRKHLTLLFYTLTSPSIITLKLSEGVLRSLEDVLGKDRVFFRIIDSSYHNIFSFFVS